LENAVNGAAGRRVASVVTGLLVLFGIQAGTASATGAATCSGGSVAAGHYSSLTIAGFCTLDAGNVSVSLNLTVAPGAGLLAAFGGSNLIVGQNVSVGAGSILVLGCEPEAFPCFNDNPVSPTMSTHDTVGLNLIADGALMMLIHGNHIGRNVSQSGGGGGVTCNLFPVGPNGPPAYSTYEDNTIGGNASISGVQTCWMGFIRNTVAGNVNYTNNVLADPDGNEVVTNTIGRNLNCSGNDPVPQVGDSQGSPNTVGGRATGQCA
jgi:hypothetical protein